MNSRTILAGIVLLALAVRLYHVTFPVAGFAAWRQADTAAMAKNFYENGFDISRPQIDWGGNSAGYVETEFPLYSYLISLLYAAFAPDDMWGRLLSVVFSLGAVAALYLLVKKNLGEFTACSAAIVYAVLPLNIFYARAIMPESMMLMCSILGVYFFSEWVDRGRVTAFFMSAGCIACAALLKLTALYLGVPLLFLAWQKYGATFLRRPILWVYSALVLIPVVFWYYHAHQLFHESGLSFGIWDYGTGKWGNFSPLLTFKFYNDVFFKSIAERHLTYPGFMLFVIGLFIRRQRTEEKLFDWWLVGVLVFFAIVTRGNQVHEYYQLPFTIPAVIFIAKTLNKFLSPGNIGSYWRTRRPAFIAIALCTALVPVLGFMRYQNYMSGERLDGSIFELGNAVRQATESGALVVAVDESDPVVLYRCGRRGWHASPDQLTDSLLIQRQKEGARYLVGTMDFFDSDERKARLQALIRKLSAVAEEPNYFIIRLDR